MAQIGGLEPTKVAEGDIVIIPAGTSQKITNIGKNDLLFYCICTPAFRQDRYHDEEP
jgi:mannose-6-phosphate isomerase-like protein (cupin superfamily)